MSFGLVQLGQAAASLGDGEMAYECLVHLANRFWLGNLASMHNHKSLFNMDISGGMPAVLIKMLVASEPGKIQLLPALPPAWSSGTIEGVLCRGQVEVSRLHWDADGILVSLTSARKQTVTLQAPSEIGRISAQKGRVAIQTVDRKDCRRITLPARKEVTLRMKLKTP